MTRFKKVICNDAFENWDIADVFRYVGISTSPVSFSSQVITTSSKTAESV